MLRTTVAVSSGLVAPRAALGAAATAAGAGDIGISLNAQAVLSRASAAALGAVKSHSVNAAVAHQSMTPSCPDGSDGVTVSTSQSPPQIGVHPQTPLIGDSSDPSAPLAEVVSSSGSALLAPPGSVPHRKVQDTERAYIFQEYLASTKGRDIRAFIVGDRVVASMMRIAAKGQFKANVHQGGTVKSTRLQQKLERMVLKTSRLCHLEIAGVDVLLDKDTYKVCEVNSSPGFEGLERATGESAVVRVSGAQCSVFLEMLTRTDSFDVQVPTWAVQSWTMCASRWSVRGECVQLFPSRLSRYRMIICCWR